MEVDQIINGTRFRYGHRWTNESLKTLMQMWSEGIDVDEMALRLSVSRFSIMKMVVRLRQNGIPLKRRTKGHKAGRRYLPWTQSEVEYLVKQRKNGITAETIGVELGRSVCGVNAMIAKIRSEGVSVAMCGRGNRRLWSVESLLLTSEAK